MPAIGLSFNDPSIPQDLWPSIRDLDAINNYVVSNAPTIQVYQRLHQWVNDPITPVTGQNVTAEGQDTIYSNTDPVMQSNVTEIIEYGVKISETDENSKHMAIGDRWAREKLKKMEIWKNQAEWDAINGSLSVGNGSGSVTNIIMMSGGSYTVAPTGVTFSAPTTGTTTTGTVIYAGGQVTGIAITVAGTGYTAAPSITFVGGTGSGAAAYAVVSTTARAAAGMIYQVTSQSINGATNTNVGTSGGVPLTSGAFNGFLGASAAFGKTVNTILVNGPLKSRISSFTVNNTRNVDASSMELVQAVDVYSSDFGIVTIQYHRYVPTTGVLGYIKDYFSIGFLDQMHYTDRPANGYYMAGAVVGEVTYQLANQYAAMYQFGLN